MANFRVILNIDIEAENPLEAAKELERWSKEEHLSYYVQNEDTKEISSVDLDAEDEDAILIVNDKPNNPIEEAFNNLW